MILVLAGILVTVLILTYPVLTVHTADPVEVHVHSLARTMLSQHKAAMRACNAACPTGEVNPRGSLPLDIQNSPDQRQYFLHLYDDATGFMVSIPTPAFAPQTGVQPAELAYEISKLVGQDTKSAGTWDADAQQVLPLSPMLGNYTQISLSTPFAGRTIPDGAPIIATFLK
ncbi:hypothetical protein ACQU0X_27245 [Pseudovibrio ascidiaceicola]|uniref:hypothetical protein n=1 Tax=Pseudovibrio ascidiaceicola TaxID=285279 RepID=UPI003D361A8F